MGYYEFKAWTKRDLSLLFIFNKIIDAATANAKKKLKTQMTTNSTSVQANKCSKCSVDTINLKNTTFVLFFILL